MDSYFKKTRRPTGLSLKRPPPSITPPKAKITNTPTTPTPTPATTPTTTTTPVPIPTTPTNARLTRPLHPPPIRRKEPPPIERRRPTSGKQLFDLVRPLEDKDELILTPIKQTSSARTKVTELTTPKATPESPSKITSGPLKGVSSSLLDIIRAKEAAARSRDPEREQQLRLLGIAPEIVRIIPTIFTASKREVLLYDKVIEKCFKGLKSNYTTETIIECIEFMDKIAPEWISTVEISKGKFMRINKDKYTIPILTNAIKKFKAKHQQQQQQH